nr:hypothetical protein [Modestobacter marinus]
MTTCPPDPCPPWCVTPHGELAGEDDRVHVGEPVVIADGVLARPCMSVEPGTGTTDGPYVLIGSTECTPAEAEALGRALIAMARAGAVTRPAAPGRRSPGP